MVECLTMLSSGAGLEELSSPGYSSEYSRLHLSLELQSKKKGETKLDADLKKHV